MRGSFVKRFAEGDCFLEQFFEFCSRFSPDIDMVVRAEEAGFEFPVGSYAEPVAECTELGVVERADNFDFRTVKAVFLPVVHSPGDDLF